MRVELTRKNEAFHFEAKNEDGLTVQLDSNPASGGQGKGVRPMENVLISLGGCSGIDVVDILKKQRQRIDDLKIIIIAERDIDNVPSLFTKIHVKFLLKGDIEENKLKRAVDLSMEKYCSVAKILEKSAEIDYSYELNAG